MVGTIARLAVTLFFFYLFVFYWSMSILPVMKPLKKTDPPPLQQPSVATLGVGPPKSPSHPYWKVGWLDLAQVLFVQVSTITVSPGIQPPCHVQSVWQHSSPSSRVIFPPCSVMCLEPWGREAWEIDGHLTVTLCHHFDQVCLSALSIATTERSFTDKGWKLL